MTPFTASIACTASVSNHSRSRSPIDMANSRVASAADPTSRPFSFQASRSWSTKSCGRLEPTFGGTSVRRRPSTSPMPSSHSSHRSRASASRLENRATLSKRSLGSSLMSRARPLGNGR